MSSPMSPKLAQQQAERAPQDVFRLTPAAFRALQKAVPGPGCPKDPLEAGFLLGVQHVLQKLRDGFVIEQ